MVVATTRLARIRSPRVMRLPAIRHASASQRRLSRRYRTKPVTMPMIPAGTSSQRYCIVVAMNAPLPSPRTITARGRRQQSEASAAPTHATKPAVSAASLMVSLLRFFCGVRPVLERQTVCAAAASNRISRLHVVGECHYLIALGAAHPVGERRGPATGVFVNAQGVPPAVRTLHQVARPRSFGQLDERATVRAADYNLVVYRDDRDGHPPGPRDQLCAGHRIVRDVLRRKINAVGRKKLFRRVTRLSG